MKKRFTAALSMIFSIAMLSLTACGGGGGGGGTAMPVTASPLPVDQTAIAQDTAIVITFSTTMDTTSLVLGGTLATESDGGVWSAITRANDTLTISPTTQWSDGAHTLTVTASDTDGNAIPLLSLSYTISLPIVPTASAVPADQAAITPDTPIVIHFSSAMDTASLVLGGSLVAESDGGVWSDGTSANDTLTISPSAQWSDGTKSLTVDASDTAGTAIATLSLSYTVNTPTPPTASATPLSPALIKGDTAIVISFSTSMARTSLILGGTLAPESNGGVWSATAAADDTLTITPTTQWGDGSKTLTVDADDTAGTAMATLSLLYTVDGTLPVASIDPADGSSITTGRSIVISYSESMNTTSLIGSGSLWGESDGGVWSTTTNLNDTLTISPASTWSVAGHTLDLTADDLAGNSRTVNLTYTVVNDPDVDGDGYPASIDCDDSDKTVFPGATEICDGLDNDCNTSVDDNLTLPSYPNSTTLCGGAGGLYLSCDYSWEDCDGEITTGCEIDTSTNADNCGACGASCNDGFSCTQDFCSSGLCSNVTNDTLCDDTVFCNGPETCSPADAGADASTGCVSSGAPICPDADQCNVGYCDESSESCSTTPVADGEPCDDGNPITDGDACWSGICYGLLSTGESCTLDGECFSNSCLGGVCQ